MVNQTEANDPNELSEIVSDGDLVNIYDDIVNMVMQDREEVEGLWRDASIKYADTWMTDKQKSHMEKWVKEHQSIGERGSIPRATVEKQYFEKFDVKPYTVWDITPSMN